MDILLASKSPTRAKLLKNAGIPFQAVSHGVDEEEIKMSEACKTLEILSKNYKESKFASDPEKITKSLECKNEN